MPVRALRDLACLHRRRTLHLPRPKLTHGLSYVASGHEQTLTAGELHFGVRARVELEKVLLDAVTEDDAVVGHLRREREHFALLHASEQQRRLRAAARKWLAH